MSIKRQQKTQFKRRWVRSVKEECLSNLSLFGDDSLRNALNEYVEHYHKERNHQRKDNVILFPSKKFDPVNKTGVVKRKERLGGLLKYYYREAA